MAESDEPRTRNLAAVTSGERVTITRILGRGALKLCRSLGLHEGDRIRCRSATGFHVWVESARGDVVAVERDWARYIAVLPAPTPGRGWAHRRPGRGRRARTPE